MLETMKKLVVLIMILVVLFLLFMTRTWKDNYFRDLPTRLIYQDVGQQATSRAPKFRITLNGEVVVEEDFNNRPRNTVFNKLQENLTVKINKSDIGKVYPVSSYGPVNKFPLYIIFRPTISQTDKILFLYVLQKFIDVCNVNNINFFLYDGSLIGSYRHHGFIPWDDDVDVFVNSSQKHLLAKEGAKVPGFQVFTPKNFQWKFFHRNLSTSIGAKEFRWPYIDIFFWEVSSTHLYDYTRFQRGKSYEKAIVFPLQFRPFEGALLKTPINTRAFLKKKYDIEECQTNTYSHRYEEFTRWAHKVPCEKLEKFYPFVKHERKTLCEEHLIYKGHVIRTFTSNDC